MSDLWKMATMMTLMMKTMMTTISSTSTKRVMMMMIMQMSVAVSIHGHFALSWVRLKKTTTIVLMVAASRLELIMHPTSAIQVPFSCP
jgi:hypothetical protein